MVVKTNSTTPRNVKLLPCVVYGSAFAMLIFYGIRSGWIRHPLIDRYVMGHPVSVVETMMLCVGLLALAFKSIGLIRERKWLQQWESPSLEELPFLQQDAIALGEQIAPSIGAVPADIETPEMLDDYQKASGLLQVLQLRQVLSRTSSHSQSTMTQRLESALKFVQSRRSAEGIEDHLKHLAGQDADGQYESYSLIRLMVWAIPMLGFLGTVLGISEALGGLDLGADADLSALIGNLKSSLYVAFDTTALALTYGVILMFFQFGLDRTETSFIQEIDRKTDDYMLSSFATTQSERDPIAKSIQRMGQALLKATFSLVEHQHDLWNESLTAAQDAWITATENSQNQTEHVLRGVVDAASDRLVDKLGSAMELADQQIQHRWQQWQVTLSDNARAIAGFQKNATSHIEMLEQFFQNASHLSEGQQATIQKLIGHLDALVVQSQQLQEQQLLDMEQRQAVEEEKRRQRQAARKRNSEREAAALAARRMEQELNENFVGPLTYASWQENRRRREQQGLEAGWIRESRPVVAPAVPTMPRERRKTLVVAPAATSRSTAAEIQKDSEMPAVQASDGANIHPMVVPVATESVRQEQTLSPSFPTVASPEFRIQPRASSQWATWNPLEHSQWQPRASIQPTVAEAITNPIPPTAPVSSPELETPSPEIPLVRFVQRKGAPMDHSAQRDTGNQTGAMQPMSQPLSAEIPSASVADVELKLVGQEPADRQQTDLFPWDIENLTAEEAPETINPNIRSVLIPFSDAKIRRAS